MSTSEKSLSPWSARLRMPKERTRTTSSSNRASWNQRLFAIFLPAGYPQSVSHDYTKYHVYNAIQVFSSTIAGLFANRAVLQGMGVGDQNASATNAVVLTVIQESMGRFATILFAHQVGTVIEAECKMYRLLADFLADAAMISDCLSPLLPPAARIPILGASSIFRAMCGIASANSKQTLSSHFARGGQVPVAELNSKDASQETITSLIAMWMGTVIVAHATSTASVWIWLLLLALVHLWTNYLAVSSVGVHSINRNRANIIFSSLIEQNTALSPKQVAKQERIFNRPSTVRWHGWRRIGTCEIGVTTAKLLHSIDTSNSAVDADTNLNTIHDQDLFNIGKGEQYLLWVDPKLRSAFIVLGDRATVRCQLKAWSHALRVLRILEARWTMSESEVLELILSTKKEHSNEFDRWMEKLEVLGWETRTSPLEPTKAHRYELD